MIAWRVGSRERRDAVVFINDVAARVSGRVQITTDGYTPYISAIESAFGADADYGIVNKVPVTGGIRPLA